MSDERRHVLFLCTGNSARSILAEAILDHVAADRFHAHSAGSHPRGEVHPLALELLTERGFDVTGLRSKGWEEFATADAPEISFVFTVCDNAAGEACPVWPGHPLTAHWGVADPAAVTGPDARAAFRRAFAELERRIRLFCVLPTATLDRLTLQARLDEIGKS